jgi:hypothetical protein
MMGESEFFRIDQEKNEQKAGDQVCRSQSNHRTKHGLRWHARLSHPGFDSVGALGLLLLEQTAAWAGQHECADQQRQQHDESTRADHAVAFTA